MTAEEWRPVLGFPDYVVSSTGRVVSHKRKQPLELKPVMVKGYRCVGVSADSSRQFLKGIHALVAEAFYGPRPAGQEVRHLDGNPLNNAVENLRFGTRSENVQDSIAHGTHYISYKTHCKKGHEFTPENSYPRSDGRGRGCRTCRAAVNRAYRERKMFRAANVQDRAA